MAHALVPGFGGTTVITPFLPMPTTLIRNTPPPDFLIDAPLMGPLSPLGSFYLNPFTASPLQKGLPVLGLVP